MKTLNRHNINAMSLHWSVGIYLNFLMVHNKIHGIYVLFELQVWKGYAI